MIDFAIVFMLFAFALYIISIIYSDNFLKLMSSILMIVTSIYYMTVPLEGILFEYSQMFGIVMLGIGIYIMFLASYNYKLMEED